MSHKIKVQLKILSNDGDVAVFRDLTQGQDGTMERSMCGASRQDFLRDLAPGTVKEAEAIATRSERVYRKEIESLSAMAKQSHRPKI